jgi:hypothetical protein
MGRPAGLAVHQRAAALQAARPGKRVRCHTETPRPRPSNGHGRRRPSDGDAVSGGRRRAPQPGVSPRVGRLLRRPAGRCPPCGYACTAGDVRDVAPRIPRPPGGCHDGTTWPWWPRYGHGHKPARERRRCAGQAPHVWGAECRETGRHGCAAEAGGALPWPTVTGCGIQPPRRRRQLSVQWGGGERS